MNTRSATIPRYQYAFFILCVFAITSIVAYLFAVNQTVRNAVVIEQMERKVSDLLVDISDMEFQYITTKNTIDLEDAHELGFRTAQAKTFVSRETSVALAPSAERSR